MKDRPIDKKVKQKLNYARKNWPDNLGRYEQQEKQLGNRSRAIGISKQFEQDGFQKLERELVFSSKILPKTSKKIFIKY